MFSDASRGGRADTPRGAAIAAVRVAHRALELVATDTEESYLINGERQLAIERLLIRFGEALKSIPNEVLDQIDSRIDWAGPKGFRDIAAHWYEEGLDHGLIWQALANDLRPMVVALQKWIDAGSAPLDVR